MKLSEFKGQEHVTGPLRAMIIKGEISNKIALHGDRKLAEDIAYAFLQSLNCPNVKRGDACGECATCEYQAILSLDWPVKSYTWEMIYVSSGRDMQEFSNSVYVTYNTELDGFMNFQLKTPAGCPVPAKFIEALIHSAAGQEQAALAATQELVDTYTSTKFVETYLELFKTLIYLKHNLEVAQFDKVELLRTLANRIPNDKLTTAVRVLWDSLGSQSVLPANLSIPIVTMLVAQVFHPSKPTDNYSIEASTEKTPISGVETIPERSLTVDEMLEIARA